MKIKEIIYQHRRDFRAIYECEHCKHEVEKTGYDDSYFHQEVIPNMECNMCGKKSPDNYRALSPKYAEGTKI